MSDYSNLKIEKVDDIPEATSAKRGALSIERVYKTLPFLKEMKIGETVKFPVPEDNFGYAVNKQMSPNMRNYYVGVDSALKRSLRVISARDGLHFICRVRNGEMYIKRIAG